MKNRKSFRELNEEDGILHIGNVWDVQSAIMFEKKNYQAIGTSSLAIAHSLGYEDGEEISFEELYSIVKQILLKVNIPLSVDIEGGYSRDVKTIIDNIISLHKIGVVGINIEDSVMIDGVRQILSAEVFTILLKEITETLKRKNIDMFINVRIDSFIMELPNALDESIKRIKLYEQNGADAIFIPCLVDIDDIKKVIDSTILPINIMTIPNLSSFDILENLGIKRVSQGSFFYDHLMQYFENKLNKINNDKSFDCLFE